MGCPGTPRRPARWPGPAPGCAGWPGGRRRSRRSRRAAARWPGRGSAPPRRSSAAPPRLKCSVAKICSGWSTASAVPGALVPACASSQRAPGTKFIDSAPRSIERGPLDPEQPPVRVADRHQVVAVVGQPAQQVPEDRQHPGQRMRRPVGLQVAVAQLDRRGAVRTEPGRSAERRHESATTDRICGTGRSPVTNRSWARPTWRIRSAGSAPRSRASQGLATGHLQSPS